MAPDGRFHGKQAQFVEQILAGATVAAAAKRVGIGERTAYRWLTLPHVRARLAQGQDLALEALAHRLAASMGIAISTLIQIMGKTDASDGARVSAAGKTLDAGLRWRELVALAQRVADLEKIADDTKKQNWGPGAPGANDGAGG